MPLMHLSYRLPRLFCLSPGNWFTVSDQLIRIVKLARGLLSAIPSCFKCLDVARRTSVCLWEWIISDILWLFHPVVVFSCARLIELTKVDSLCGVPHFGARSDARTVTRVLADVHLQIRMTLRSMGWIHLHMPVRRGAYLRVLNRWRVLERSQLGLDRG